MSSQPSEARGAKSSGGGAGVLEPPAKSKSSSETPSFVEDHDTLVKIYHEMVMIRRFEEKCAESYSLGKIGGVSHFSIGLEAVTSGGISLFRRDDYVLTSYREHGHAIAKGISPEAMMAHV